MVNMPAALVAGIDSSTQSTKVVLCQSQTGEIVGQASAPHPGGTECDPQAWWEALQQAGNGLIERAAAIGIAGQQHGMIALDEDGSVVRRALLWNDLRSARSAADLVAERGGPRWWAVETGSVPTASFTVTKLRWLAENEPANAARTASVLLPHDWLTWRLRQSGASVPPAVEAATTDRGDASGTGYFSTASGTWLPDLATAAIGHPLALPAVAGPSAVVGETASGAWLSAGTGDNMAAALGLGLGPGDVTISVGTSGTAFAVSAVPAADPSGAVAGFADASGAFLPLVCTINAAGVLTAAAALTGTTLAELSDLALAAEPGAGGLTLLPYLDGERTPDRPGATGVLRGLTSANAARQNLARAAVEAVLASLAEAAALLTTQGVPQERVLVIGGGARSEAIRRLAPGIFGAPVLVPAAAEYVALGAARQAAWALAGTPAPPDWPPATPPARYEGDPQPGIRQRHAALRADTAAWLPGDRS
jgi:xylulokinase